MPAEMSALLAGPVCILIPNNCMKGLFLAIAFALVAATTPVPVMAATGSTTVTSGFSIPNPIKCNSVSCVIRQVIKTVLGVIAVVATLMFIWGGILMMTSGGDSKRVQQGKETLTWAAIGLVVILLSWSIISFVLKSLTKAESSK
jgi:hypothetical protein